MKRLVPHLVCVAAVCVLLVFSSQITNVMAAEVSRTWKTPAGLYVIKGLLFVLIGFLLTVPGWWGSEKAVSINWAILFTYVLPGTVLVGSTLLVQWLVAAFGPEVRGGAAATISFLYEAARGGGQSVGGIMVGFGIGRALHKG